MVRRSLKFFIISLLFITCNQSEPATKSIEIREPEEILVEIMESYQNFSKDPDKSVEIIWNNAHQDNKEVTGPIDRFKLMITSEPYNSIIDLTDYSYEIIQEDGETIHYEIKILNNKNEYFIVTWVFVFDECELSGGMCWQTIGVSAPMYFDSGI
ncbi:MAG: hypothetical protein CL497_00495 [Actinobacteria bacterium]|nr:hypothetical protein [Actinomycetota bacterium]